MAVSRRASENPTGDWTSEVRKYAGDPYAKQTLDALTQFAEQKTTTVGQMTYTASVVSVEPNRIVLNACIDNSGLKLFVDGVEIDPVKPNGSRFQQTVRIYKNEQSATGWLVSEVENGAAPC